MSKQILDKLTSVKSGFDMEAFEMAKQSASNIKINNETEEEHFQRLFDNGVRPSDIISNPRLLQAYSEFYMRHK